MGFIDQIDNSMIWGRGHSVTAIFGQSAGNASEGRPYRSLFHPTHFRNMGGCLAELSVQTAI